MGALTELWGGVQKEPRGCQRSSLPTLCCGPCTVWNKTRVPLPGHQGAWLVEEEVDSVRHNYEKCYARQVRRTVETQVREEPNFIKETRERCYVIDLSWRSQVLVRRVFPVAKTAVNPLQGSEHWRPKSGLTGKCREPDASGPRRCRQTSTTPAKAPRRAGYRIKLFSLL